MSISRPGRVLETCEARCRSSGLLAHGRDDHHDLVTALERARDVIGDLTDAIGIGNGRATELLDDETHGR